MEDLSPPIGPASIPSRSPRRDEIEALQIQALAVVASPCLRQRSASTASAFDAKGVHRERSQGARRIWRNFPLHRQGSDLRRLPIPSACSRCRANSWCVSTSRPAPPASRRWSATPRNDIAMWAELHGPLHARRRHPCRRHRARGLRLRPVHRRASAPITAAERLGCTVVPVSGGMTARQVHAHGQDFKPRG
jgi:hypothetical protein